MSRAAICCWAGFLVGCGTSPPAHSTGPESGAESESGDTESESESETDSPMPDSPGHAASLVGFVVDELGAPLVDLPITLCGAVCQIATTDAEGRFEVLDIDPGVKVIEPALVPVDGDLETAVKSWTRFFDFVEVGADQAIVLEQPFVMLRVEGTVGPLGGPHSLDLLPELHVDIDADAIVEAGALPVGIDEPWLGARAIPVELWPQNGLDDWTIVAAFGLAVWDLEAPDGFAVEVTLPEALPPDAEVGFLVADYEYGFQNGKFFEEIAQLSDDGLIVSTPPEGGLDRATMWLAVTR